MFSILHLISIPTHLMQLWYLEAMLSLQSKNNKRSNVSVFLSEENNNLVFTDLKLFGGKGKSTHKIWSDDVHQWFSNWVTRHPGVPRRCATGAAEPSSKCQYYIILFSFRTNSDYFQYQYANMPCHRNLVISMLMQGTIKSSVTLTKKTGYYSQSNANEPCHWQTTQCAY